MPETFQALGVLALGLLPGALYVWSFERLVGLWGIRLADRILRFIGVSAILHVLLSPVTYRLWIDWVRSGRLSAGEAPFVLWLVLLIYIALPIALGSAVGIGTQRGGPWARIFTGPTPAPRAWDHLFGTRPDGWIRLRLKTGEWIAGTYTQESENRKSYAAGYPEDQDLSSRPSRSTQRLEHSSTGTMNCPYPAVPASWSDGRRSSTWSSLRDNGQAMDEEKSGMAKTNVTKRGGYEPGPKSMSQLKPPPKTLGAGAKSNSGSSSGKSDKK